MNPSVFQVDEIMPYSLLAFGPVHRRVLYGNGCPFDAADQMCHHYGK
jgi:hypothetical protein